VIRRILTDGLDEFDLTRLDVYRARGGYEALTKALKTMTPEGVAGEVKTSNLRGRGGAGFPTGVKWSTLPNDGRPRYLLINGDESEPGSFSGRMLIEKNPHMIIEGVLLAAFACNMARSFIYLRGEFYEGAEILQRAVDQAREAGLLGEHILGTDFSQEIVVHRGAGAYICGEETAIMESLEGKRGHPRNKPPFPTQAGVYAMPTVINNVETIANVVPIVANGGAWFAAIGPEKSPGTKICSISGRVRRPGNYEIEMGTPLRELLEEHAGGLEPGHSLKFILPAGASSALVLPTQLDTPLDFDSMMAIRSMLGSAGMLVCDDRDCAAHVAYLGARFYHHESCGKCTPCREGTGWTEKVLHRMEHGEGRPGDTKRLEDLCAGIGGRKCLCLLGDFSVTYLQSALRAFRDEFVAHEQGGPCPVAHAALEVSAR
jgi:NADH-quinone oxidoreductase subunit F